MLVVTIKRRLLLLRERPQESVDGRRALLCHELRLRYFCDVSRVAILTIPPGLGPVTIPASPRRKLRSPRTQNKRFCSPGLGTLSSVSPISHMSLNERDEGAR